MINQSQDNEVNPEFKALYPPLNEEQLLEAQENLKRYLELASTIYERVKDDPEFR